MTIMTKSGIDARRNCPFNRVEKGENGGFKVVLESGEVIETDMVLSALGRPPLVDPLKLENAGVEVAKGAVKVDEF